MEEISDILYEIRANIKALPFKTKGNTLLISVFFFLIYTSYDIKQSFRKKLYDLLITGILIFLIFFNFSLVKDFLNKNIFYPIIKYFFGEDDTETYEAKRLLK